MFDPQLYRTKAEVEEWKKRDPITRFTAWLQGTGAVHEGDLAAIESATATEITVGVAFAVAGTWEPAETLTKDVYAEVAP
jgi:TPP-dependent pyruvate/acetoin dehydrogenase alpha subunit